MGSIIKELPFGLRFINTDDAEKQYEKYNTGWFIHGDFLCRSTGKTPEYRLNVG